MTPKPKVTVFDNGGETADRYSVWVQYNPPHGLFDLFTIGDYPFSSQGVNMWGGQFEDMTTNDGEKRVAIKDLPKDVQRAIQERLKLA